ncbi:SRPBCC family protein [Rhodococcus sp. NPDC019627]|jgi:phenylpropionate dioxygenase-like ring-hydroxylating dioxygenase large terminal subunit|uniref:aromatic ring-hydroxylating oxygenase subunit alpha n=1 Tax=unclassified Rhodococcus (in: high G+C Gram-positive bacteria) TaxID=192944 RepID=UPI00131FE356|nr:MULTISPECIES: SRPBCC family protein [unclassified Rhodococcus (in: high G+C Gram-positive bacteria)]QHE70522.1 ring hydroxylating dioxygenase, large subunit of terminal oxygenase [Rhodococcus sp. WAY2]
MVYTDLPYDEETKAGFARAMFDHLDNGTTDMAPEILEVDPRVYTDPELAARERRELFGYVPIIAAHSTELPGNNDFATVQLPNNEVVLVRQADGRVRGFVNTCRHRGAQLVPEEKGSKRIFSCRYHGWAYGSDGRLRSIADEPTFGTVDRSCMSLLEVPVEERHGFVWVIDSAAGDRKIDIAEWLGREFDESLAAMEMDKYHCHIAQNFDVDINWKVLMDAFLDGYHITSTHAGTVAPYFYNNAQAWEPMGRHGRMVTARKSIDSVRDVAPEDAPIDRHITVAHFLMPNMSVLRQPDHLEVLNFVPAPGTAVGTRMQMRLLTREPVVTDEQKARWDKNWKILMAVLRDEDLVVNEGLQKSVANTDVGPLYFGRNEIANQHFHQWMGRAFADPRKWG